MITIYSEFWKIVKSKGQKVEEFFTLRGEKSVWIIGDLLIVLDEAKPRTEASKIVVVIDREKEAIIYLSPYALKAGAREIFEIEDSNISSEEKLKEILEKIK